MPEEKKFEEGFGFLATPDDPRDYRIETLLGAASDLEVPLPESYIVPWYRECFDENFNPIPEKIRAVIRNQYGRPTCVGESTAAQKSAQEKERMSARDDYRQAKPLDGSGDLLSYGTSLNAGQDAVVKGIASEKTVPQADAAMPLAQYVSQDDVTDAVRADREAHKGGSYFRVERTQFRRTLFEKQTAIVTWYAYHEGDRDMASNGGVMGFAAGRHVADHAQTMIGWIGGRNVFLQSWGPDWGTHGLMFVPLEVMVRFGTGRVAVDLQKNLAKLLQQYDGKNVKLSTSSDVYRCELGVLRRYPDEVTYHAFGQTFELDLTAISPEDFEAIPKGANMRIEDAPYRTRALVREIRQNAGLK